MGMWSHGRHPSFSTRATGKKKASEPTGLKDLGSLDRNIRGSNAFNPETCAVNETDRILIVQVVYCINGGSCSSFF